MHSSKVSYDANEFTGKRVLVTGGSKGIGGAITDRFQRGGATVIITARSAQTGKTDNYFIQADAPTTEGATRVTNEILNRFQGIDIIVHNVGGSSAPCGGFITVTDEIWQQALNENLFPAVRLDRGLLPSMIQRGSGVIIHISSIHPNDGAQAFCGAKPGPQDLLAQFERLFVATQKLPDTWLDSPWPRLDPGFRVQKPFRREPADSRKDCGRSSRPLQNDQLRLTARSTRPSFSTCTKTCTKMIKTDWNGLELIRLDSSEKQSILPPVSGFQRAIPTLASS